MKSIWVGGMFGVMALGLAGCGGGNSPDALNKEAISMMNEVAGVLESVKDKASGEAAIPKLQGLAKRGEDLKKRMDGLKLSKEDEKKIEEKYKKEGMEAGMRMFKAMGEASMVMEKDPALKKAFDDAMKK